MSTETAAWLSPSRHSARARSVCRTGSLGHPVDGRAKLADRLRQAVLGDEHLSYGRELARRGRSVAQGLEESGRDPVVALGLGRLLPFDGDVAEQGFDLSAEPQIGVGCAAQCREGVALGGIQLAAGQRPLGGGQVLGWPGWGRQHVNRLAQRFDQPSREQFIPAGALPPDGG